MKDTLRQLFRDVRSQKLRTFLTIFGIVWGTVAVTLLLAFGRGLLFPARCRFAFGSFGRICRAYALAESEL